ncbi:MAG: hypothetical protein ACI8RZ_004710, partial [Myxococcota bacterium]
PALVELQAGTSGSHLTGFVGLTPSPRLTPNQQSARLTTGTC